VLKLARGETFTERHWAEFLKITGLSTTSIEQVTLEDLLRAQTVLSQNFNELKVKLMAKLL
jgi:hypothetical protein